MTTPYPFFTMSAGPVVPVLVFGLAALAALVYCVVVARRERRVWPVAVFAGSMLLVTYEPFNNFLAHCAYPANGWRMLDWLGQNVPWSTWLIYMFYFSVAVPMLVKRLDRGMAMASFGRFYGCMVVICAIFEPVFAHTAGLRWWYYYGDNQALAFTGMPAFWWFANAMVVVATGVLLHLLKKHVLTRNWQAFAFVPLMPLILFGVHGSASIPVFVAITSGASPAVSTVCTLITIAISFFYVWLLGRAACLRPAAGPEVAGGVTTVTEPERTRAELAAASS